MSRPTLVPRARGPHGFVLVGVIMFVLALTIIGLTLFDLSGYEAQFFERSVDDQQAYQLAMGGVEWAKWALGVQSDLSVVRKTPLPEGIAYVRARYADNPADSSDIGTNVPVDWSGARPIEIRVLALHHLAREMVEMTYRPRPKHDYYRRLFTLSDGLYVDPVYAAETWLTGGIWQNADTTVWWSTGIPKSDILHPIVLKESVPALDLSNYWLQHWDLANPRSEASDDGDNHYYLTAGATGGIAYLKTAADPGENYSVTNGAVDVDKMTIYIDKGTVVWMFDRGLFSNNVFRVMGNANTCLVLVALPSTAPGQPAFNFQGGIETNGTPVFLVTNGEARIQVIQYSGKGAVPPTGRPQGEAGYLSVYARDLLLQGPVDYSLHYIHDPAAQVDQPGKLVDDLLEAGALPLPAGVTLRGSFQPIAGTWREVEETNPN